MTIGLAQNANGPTTYLPILPWGAWLGISLAGVILIALIIFGACYWRGRGNRAKANATKNDALLGEKGNEIGEENEVNMETKDNEDAQNTRIAHLT